MTLDLSDTQGTGLEGHRARFAAYGERVRWWKATGWQGEGTARDDGTAYVEQVMENQLRGLFFNEPSIAATEKRAPMQSGDVYFGSLNDEIELSPGDRILAIDRPKVARCHFTPSGHATDELPRKHIVSIDEVFDGVLISAAAYELDGRSIRWIGPPPVGEVSIRYRFYPQYELRDESERQTFARSDEETGNEGKSLQIVPLHLVGIGEECG